MTTEEKLQHFYDVSVESAKEEAAREIQEYKQKLDVHLEEHKQARLRQAEFELKTESDSIKRQMNKNISAEQLHIKRRLSQKQQTLKEQLFTEVKNLLEEFTSDPAYLDYLAGKVNDASSFADGDEIRFFLSPNDSRLLADLAARTGHTIEVSEEAFWGGVKAVIPSKNILIDHSFASLFESEKAEYTFDGGLPHE